MRPISIVVAPWATRTLEDEGLTEALCRALLAEGRVPLFLPWALRCVLRDGDPRAHPNLRERDRETAFKCSVSVVRALATLPGAQLEVLGPRLTEGMRGNLATWLKVMGEYVGVAPPRYWGPSARSPREVAVVSP